MKTQNETETRVINPKQCHLRVQNEGDKPVKIRGYAATFNERSADLGGFYEVIKRGAFTKSLANGADVKALVEHDARSIIGRSTAGTLSLEEDDAGLYVEINPPTTQAGLDVVKSIERGDLTGMSFGFRTVTDSFTIQDGDEIRNLEQVDIFDVSIVCYPAYANTEVAVRSLNLWKKETVPQTPNRNRATLELEELYNQG